ncbi:NUDIX hydrolase [Methylobacterium sp. NEAU 140]|uniref:NUDIX hydrolase n=1 Tax=Methylobacterium sp. NEAU 140 TaxID=3064945 RepID=UPI0027369AC6|nr:NUDIX hydrolase [Methylobacterium sp. NEAU 140]MDP4026793.1 NUDIX hydrolase [Methylobacterium sp. NEAU 140]
MPDETFRLTPLTAIEARLVPYDWPWARAASAAIEANWARRRARHPGMFDGTVLLACACAVADGTARLDLFAARYSAFIAFRDAWGAGAAPGGAVRNAFAAIVPWSADGAVLLGEMGAHTANAGQLYFPCGTPDPDDVRGAAVDLAGSAAREFLEETGLAAPEGTDGDAWVLLEGEGQLAFLRPVRFPEPAAALCARIEDHRRREAEPELAGIRLVRRRADIDPQRVPGFARAYLAHALP